MNSFLPLTNKRKFKTSRSAILLSVFCCFVTFNSNALTRTWIGWGAGGASSKTDISAAANWNGGTALLPTDDYVMVFSSSLGSNGSFNTFTLSQSAILTFKSLTVNFNGNGFAEKRVIINISKNLSITNVLSITNSTSGNADHEIAFNVTAGTVTCGSVAVFATGSGGFFGFPELNISVSNGAALVSSGAFAVSTGSSSFTYPSIKCSGLITINGTTTANSTGASQVYFDVNNSGIVNFNGAVVLGTSGISGVFLSTTNMGTSTGKFYFRNNLTFGSLGFIDPLYNAQSYNFDAVAAQTLNVSNSSVYFSNVNIGDVNSPVVTVTGSSNGSLTSNASSANLLVKNNAILNLGTRTLNRTALGGSLTLDGTATLQVTGTTGGQSGSNFPSNFSTVTTGVNTTVEYNAGNATTQTIYALPLYGNLALTNGSGSGTAAKVITDNINIKNKLDLNNNISFSIPSTKSVTLKSDATLTASVTEITTPSSVTIIYNGSGSTKGKFIVERYISAVKGWRFLAVPTNGTENIQAAWQEGQPANNTSLVGKGIQLTSNAFPNGFDLYTSTTSLKTYVPATGTWAGVGSTLAPFDNSKGGYMTFIRGDRTVNGYMQAPTATVLRTSGEIYKGDINKSLTTANQFVAVNNQYASAIDFTKIFLNSTGISEQFYVFDPKAGAAGIGGYQTITKIAGVWKAIPGGGSYPSSGPVDPYIENGQAFMVYSTSASGTVALKENVKVSSSKLVSRTSNVYVQSQGLKTNIYALNANASTVLLDAVYNDFNDQFSTAVDGEDAKKTSNFGLNLSIKNGSDILVVDRRKKIESNDTIYLNLAGVRAQEYRFQFIAENMVLNGIEAYLEDTYLNTKKPISLTDTTTVDFSIANISGSYAANRFRIIFVKLLAASPMKFAGIAANRTSDNAIQLNWKVENESNIDHYVAECSNDGINFSAVKNVLPKENNGANINYNAIDQKDAPGLVYYRIKALNNNGRTLYSDIAKVEAIVVRSSISVYPNPVAGKIMNIRFMQQAEGNYGIQLTNTAGQVLYKGQVSVNSETITRSIDLNGKISTGIYQLAVTGENGKKTSMQLIIE